MLYFPPKRDLTSATYSLLKNPLKTTLNTAT